MNVRDTQGQTALHIACERGEVGCVRELLEECQARTDIKDKNGDTPMHCAAKQDSAAVVEVGSHQDWQRKLQCYYTRVYRSTAYWFVVGINSVILSTMLSTENTFRFVFVWWSI